LETIRPYGVEKPTGIFFDKQDVSSLIDAVSFLTQKVIFMPKDCRENALRFSVERFQDEIKSYVEINGISFWTIKRLYINVFHHGWL
jgi:hypothetical protein